MSVVSFDAIAPVYDILARLIFGKSIMRAQTCFFSMLPSEARVLIIGGGTGWIIPKLLQKKKPRGIDYIDASSRMVRMAQRKYYRFKKHRATNDHTAINFIQGTENDIPPASFYDVVMTFFILDMQNDTSLKEMMEKIYLTLNPNGLWLFADFKVGKHEQKRWWHQRMVDLMFLFFRLTCHLQYVKLPDYDQAFVRHNLIREKSQSFYGHLIQSEVYRKSD